MRAHGNEPVQVVVADDQPLFREGVARIVSQAHGFALSGTAANGRDAVELIVARRPRVAVVSHDLPELSGIEFVQALRRRGSPTDVVVVAPAACGDAPYQVLEAGAVGCLTRASTAEEVLQALDSARRGVLFVADDARGALLSGIRLRADDDRPALTTREREVLGLIAAGLSVPRIAERLVLSPATIKTHTNHLFQKLEVSDRAAAVAQGMRRGLID